LREEERRNNYNIYIYIYVYIYDNERESMRGEKRRVRVENSIEPNEEKNREFPAWILKRSLPS
jgi:hypothetical protein